ncbi:hypothetical protein K492DRAFT_184992 [Lichtheimia hyalospora FSU 10163]|nr:hypothetical protein K492DRAFT_184992 [Lichtheimia hyalospora FSU 10163]
MATAWRVCTFVTLLQYTRFLILHTLFHRSNHPTSRRYFLQLRLATYSRHGQKQHCSILQLSVQLCSYEHKVLVIYHQLHMIDNVPRMTRRSRCDIFGTQLKRRQGRCITIGTGSDTEFPVPIVPVCSISWIPKRKGSDRWVNGKSGSWSRMLQQDSAIAFRTK